MFYMNFFRKTESYEFLLNIFVLNPRLDEEKGKCRELKEKGTTDLICHSTNASDGMNMQKA